MDLKTIITCFNRVREKKPLVHHITNAVTINDCANITLSMGAAPVMAEAPEEVAEMVGLAGALVLNIGTLTMGQIESMVIAGEQANDLQVPVILDPVGAGATRFRTETAEKLLKCLEITVLKGNAGEIGVLAGAGGRVRGVDSGGLAGDPLATVRGLAREYGLTVAMSGPTDVISDGARTVLVGNGHPLMGRLSGTGCMAASLTGCCMAVYKDPLIASVTAFTVFGIAGERASEASKGPYSFRSALFDNIAGLSSSDITSEARITTASSP